MGDRLLSGLRSHPIRQLPGMVTRENRFLIDAAFIVERTHKMFFGALLMTAAGRDHTFTFGCEAVSLPRSPTMLRSNANSCKSFGSKAFALVGVTSQSTTGQQIEEPCFFARCQNCQVHPSIF